MNHKSVLMTLIILLPAAAAGWKSSIKTAINWICTAS